MKKLMLIIVMGGLTASVLAAPTYFTDTYNFGKSGLIWDAKSHSWAEHLVGSNPTVDWSHQLPGSVDLTNLVSANLTIRGYGVDNLLGDWDGDGRNEGTDSVQVFLNGNSLGYLAGNVTVLPLTQSVLSQGDAYSATIDFVYNRKTIDKFWPVDSVRLISSTLNVHWDSTSPVPAVVPTPGAMSLAGVGIALVGWLRNRKTV